MKFMSMKQKSPDKHYDFADDEALQWYRKQKSKILNSLIMFCGFLLIGLAGILIWKANNKPPVTIPDITPPVLTLTTDQATVYAGEDFDYESYIDSAYDEEDGYLTRKVDHTVIDTSAPSEWSITYSVKDKAGNRTQAVLSISVIDGEEESSEGEEEDSSSDETSEDEQSDSEDEE